MMMCFIVIFVFLGFLRYLVFPEHLELLGLLGFLDNCYGNAQRMALANIFTKSGCSNRTASWPNWK